MPVVPGSLDSLLFPFAGAFSAPSFQTFRRLVMGFLSRTEDPATVWEEIELTRGGYRQSLLRHTMQALWYDVWRERQVHVVLVKGSASNASYDIALISTDMDANPAQIIERYEQRWAIERLDVGWGRNRGVDVRRGSPACQLVIGARDGRFAGDPRCCSLRIRLLAVDSSPRSSG